MQKVILFVLAFLLLSVSLYSQRMSIAGNVQDTISKQPLQNSVVIAIRIRDSMLIAHARTDAAGHFQLKDLPIDTIQVIVSNSHYGDQTYYIFGSKTNFEFDFGKIILPPKTQQLKEVVIYAFKDPVYYKGDTLIYAADSFKVKPNATVEDLLKNLSGISVDAKGKIKSQGKEISQVLVDGDEFFGSDPTAATRNLAAKGVESVQVYEKKNENAAEGADETVQVMNLKLKDDAKKGYFGKVSGATDFQKFYEGELLANKFKGAQKISLFALGSNTPRSNFGWGDTYKYGLDNEMNTSSDEDGNAWWMDNGNQNNGIPINLKSGIYYADRISKKTKINLNYSYNNHQMTTNGTTRSQYFLKDTNYVTDNVNESTSKNETHNINMKLVQSIDSLTELVVQPKVAINSSQQGTYSSTKYLTSSDSLTHQADVNNTNYAKGYNIDAMVSLTHKFKKKYRLLAINYDYKNSENRSTGILKSYNTYFNLALPNDSINQQKLNASNTQTHNALVTYTEPLTKKIKLEFEYNFNYSKGFQDKSTNNFFNGEYSVKDSIHTNDFENTCVINRVGTKFIFETKKVLFTFVARVRNVDVTSTNLITQSQIKQSINNVLPNLGYVFRFNQNSRFRFNYRTASDQPSINQLQPIPDNSNPNRVVVGNPDLVPTFKHTLEASYNTYKPITGKYVWANINFTTVDNAFANAIVYDSYGRTVSQTVNVNGNYNSNFYVGGGLPFFGRKLQLEPNVNGGYNSYSSFINNQKNTTQTANINSGLGLRIQLDTIEFGISYNYNYSSPSSSLSTAGNQPFSEQQFDANLNWKFPYKFILESDVSYRISSNRAAGYNINYVLWNASISKMFFKLENLIVTVSCNDILDQNISNTRNVQDNVITDTKTNIVSRYLLLKLTYKFNSTKTKDRDDEM